MKNLLILLLFTVAGCQQSGSPLTQADKDAIQKNIDGFAQAVSTKSPDIGNGYAEDVVSLPPNEEANVGKEKTVEFHLSPGPKASSFTVTSEEIEGTSELAYSRGTWIFKGVLNDSIDINDNGKYLVLLKKQPDDSWKVIREIWNTSLPLATP